MHVIRAKTAGFCMGVSLALRRLDREIQVWSGAPSARPGGRLATFGPIIHNPLVMKEYAALGVSSEENPDALNAGDRVVIRAHGIPHEVEYLLRGKGMAIVDATCPKVKKAQLSIAGESASTGLLLLFGEPEHPEVRGLLSYAGPGAQVFSHPDELALLVLDEAKSYFLAAQTTQDRNLFEQVAAQLQERLGGKLNVLDTICDATRQRQSETIELARQVDIVVVVGGLNSGNTRRLAEVARTEGTPAIHVEQAADLQAAQFSGMRTVGLTAGASTPESHIDAVQTFLEQL